MRVHGWCEKCRRVRRIVNVRASRLGCSHRYGRAPVGVCDECDTKARFCGRE